VLEIDNYECWFDEIVEFWLYVWRDTSEKRVAEAIKQDKEVYHCSCSFCIFTTNVIHTFSLIPVFIVCASIGEDSLNRVGNQRIG
jgi:hypothetical protein